MAKSKTDKEIIIEIKTRLSDVNLAKHTRAAKELERRFSNWNNFLKAAVKNNVSLGDVETLHIRYLAAKKRIHDRILQARKKEAQLAKLHGARIGYNLSLLFFSWSVSRKINNILSGWFKNYQKITQGQVDFSNAVNESSAAMTYLGFVIVDTFSRSNVVRGFVQMFVQLVNAVAEFVSANPEISVGIIIGGVTITTVAALAQWVAQISLFVDSVKNLKKLGKVSKTISIVVDLFTPETFKELWDYFRGKKKFKKLTIPAKISVVVAEIVIAAEVLKKIAEYSKKLGEALEKSFTKTFGRDLSRKIAITFGEFIYDFWTALGPLGKGLYKMFFGEDIDNLKKKLEKLKLEDKIAEIQKKTGDLTISQEQLNKAIDESKVKSFWEDVATVLDKVIDKYNELLRKQAIIMNNLGISGNEDYLVYKM